MKLKTFNNRYLKLITCYCFLYLINLPEVIKYSDPEILFKTNILIILDIFVVSCLSTFLPCIHYLNKGEKMDEKVGKKVCFYNFLITFALGMLCSVFMVKTYGYYYFVTTAIGSVVFYFVNLLFFVDYKPKNNCAVNVLSYMMAIATILIILIIGINFVRSTVDPPSYRIEDSHIINDFK